MTPFIKLKAPPIKEIIFSISFNENVEIDKLQEFTSLSAIREKFPQIDKGYHAHVETKPSSKPVSTISTDGFLLKSDSRIIQARRGSFSFHKVEEYESFDVLKNELVEYWNLLYHCIGKLTINNLTLRYVNFIPLASDEKMEDLLTINTKHPFEEKIENCFTKLSFKYQKNPDISANVVVANGLNKNSNIGVILDIILNQTINTSIESANIIDSFVKMREIKNSIFFASISEKAINKFNQQ